MSRYVLLRLRWAVEQVALEFILGCFALTCFLLLRAQPYLSILDLAAMGLDSRNGNRARLFEVLTFDPTGPVTDYGATVTHWLHNRVPKYRGSYNGEAERPSPSYIVDVSICPITVSARLIIHRCYLLQPDQLDLRTAYLSSTFTHP